MAAEGRQGEGMEGLQVAKPSSTGRLADREIAAQVEQAPSSLQSAAKEEVEDADVPQEEGLEGLQLDESAQLADGAVLEAEVQAVQVVQASSSQVAEKKEVAAMEEVP